MLRAGAICSILVEASFCKELFVLETDLVSKEGGLGGIKSLFSELFLDSSIIIVSADFKS